MRSGIPLMLQEKYLGQTLSRREGSQPQHNGTPPGIARPSGFDGCVGGLLVAWCDTAAGFVVSVSAADGSGTRASA